MAGHRTEKKAAKEEGRSPAWVLFPSRGRESPSSHRVYGEKPRGSANNNIALVMAGGGRRPPGLLWGPRSHHPGKLGCPAKHGAPARDMSCYPSIHSCCGQGQRTREYSAVRCYRSLAEGQMLEWPSQGLQRIGTVMKQGKVSRPPPSAAQTGVGVTQVRGAY